MWSLGVANVGDGKSQGLDDLVTAAKKVCEEVGAMYAVGEKPDGFHFLESQTHASAMDKTKSTEGYLCVAVGDAARALDKSAAKGGKTDRSQRIDLEVFLDAAHGKQLCHQTMKDRDNFWKEKNKPPH